MSEVMRIPVPADGPIRFTGKRTITEKEIVEQRDEIVQILHAAYLTLSKSMAGFQNDWNKAGILALPTSAGAGLSHGGGAWVDDQKVYLDKETWVGIAEKLQNLGRDTANLMATHSKKQLSEMKRKFNILVTPPLCQTTCRVCF